MNNFDVLSNYKSNIFGMFDPLTFGLTIENLAETQKLGDEDIERITKIASTSPWKFDEEKLKHQKNLNSIIAYVLMKEHIGTLV